LDAEDGFHKSPEEKTIISFTKAMEGFTGSFLIAIILLPYHQGKLSPSVLVSYTMTPPNCRSLQAGSDFQIRAQFPSLAPSQTLNIPSF